MLDKSNQQNLHGRFANRTALLYLKPLINTIFVGCGESESESESEGKTGVVWFD